MRILALDYGSKRIGVALSDEMKIIAQPLEFIPAKPFTQVIDRLDQIQREKQVEMILVGLPRNMNGSYGPAATKVQEFVESLKSEVAIPVRTWDERLTTAQATRALVAGRARRDRRRTSVDQMAAAILLQSYLDRATSEA